MNGISKSFGELKALTDVNFSASQGEITAVVGENGAGKSTLMKILYGLIQPDSGTIKINGKNEKISSPSQAIKLGIGMVHQHFMLAGNLTALENIILGKEKTGFGGVLKLTSARKIIQTLACENGLELDLSSKAEDLPVGIQQKIEILKILYRDSHIIILDEPTAVLTPQEVTEFFTSLRKMAETGKTVILITHKIKEVLSISDKIVVLSRGRVTADIKTREATYEKIALAITGEAFTESYERKEPERRKIILSVKDLTVHNDNNIRALNSISFEVNGGEIFGIAGVEGNGQNELTEVICGIRKPQQGEVLINGSNPHPSRISHIPADRLKHGVVREFSLLENMILGRQRENKFSSTFRIHSDVVKNFTDNMISEYNINPPFAQIKISAFSGGNQQKAVAARELSKEPELIIASQPTRGLDIKASIFIRRKILQEAEKGKAVLLFSSDLEELISLSNIIAVIYRGKFVAILKAKNTDEIELGEYMTGLKSV